MKREQDVMIDISAINYLWQIIQGGVIGNAAYDALKLAVGKSFPRLEELVQAGSRREFDHLVSALIQSNTELREALESSHCTHSGSGDIVGGNKIVNINNISPTPRLELHAIHGEQVVIDHPEASRIQGPSYLLSATNKGNVPVLVRKLGALFSNGEIGTTPLESTIEVGITANWQFAKSTSMRVDAGVKLEGMRFAGVRRLDEQPVRKLFIEDHTGNRFWLNLF